MNKQESQREHARRRAMERYGLNFGPVRRDEAIRQITCNEAVFLEARSNRERVFAVRLEDDGEFVQEWYPVAYDKEREEIATFLPRDYLKRHRDKIDSAGNKPL